SVPTSMRQSISDFFRTKVVVASSAAALVSERGYKSMPTNKSTAMIQKNRKIEQFIDTIT
ncbi:hypothetical protein, partial [Neorhizobium huautlense]|uniref:hypothetical protein n=1 Tax=Neorhizobium huautlense TaxID=67774 RepID=UPI00197B7B15